MQRAKAEIARERWAALDGTEPLPADDQEAVAAYFDHCGDESMISESVELEGSA